MHPPGNMISSSLRLEHFAKIIMPFILKYLVHFYSYKAMDLKKQTVMHPSPVCSTLSYW